MKERAARQAQAPHFRNISRLLCFGVVSRGVLTTPDLTARAHEISSEVTMAAAGKTEEERRLAESGEQVEPVSAPMSPACGTFLQFVGTVNTLWGSDRVLRMGQFLGRYVHGAPEVSAEAE